MSDWKVPTSFSTDDLVRAEDFQKFWLDLDLLKNPVVATQSNPGPASGSWTFSSVGAWADIDSSAYQVTFESRGNPLVIWAEIQITHSAVDGDTFLRFTIDGTPLGGTAGLGYNRDHANNLITRTISTIASGIAEGEHTIVLQVNNQDTGNTEVWKSACLGIHVWEL